jgi:hypothetical protein
MQPANLCGMVKRLSLQRHEALSRGYHDKASFSFFVLNLTWRFQVDISKRKEGWKDEEEEFGFRTGFNVGGDCGARVCIPRQERGNSGTFRDYKR